MSASEEEDGKQLTVAELIAELQRMPQDLVVWHEGCDCWGEADGCHVESMGASKKPVVLITRSN